MKRMLIALIALSSISAMAQDCLIKTKARMKGYPLAFSFQEEVTQAQDLQDCIDQAKEKLGMTYRAYVHLPGGLDGGGASGMATYIIKKVKYKFTEDETIYTGSIR